MHPAIEAHHRRLRKTAQSGDLVRCARTLAPKLPASTTICEPESSFSINGLPLTTLRKRGIRSNPVSVFDVAGEKNQLLAALL
jgi:hypothetical protein